MKKIKSILIIVSLVILVGVVVIGIFDNKGTSKEKIIMVTEAGFAPYEFYKNNEIVGVDVEIAKKIAEKLGKELEIKDTDFDSIFYGWNDIGYQYVKIEIR